MENSDFKKPLPGKESLYPPKERRQQLPSGMPKPREEDPNALDRVRQIMDNPSYRRADQDLDLLKRDELRGTRLQLEFLKPELILKEHGICGTIVVLGGTRIIEPTAARHKVERARRALEQHPQIPELKHRLTVAERILTKSHYYDVARELGRLVGRAGRGPGDCRLAIVTGGGPGLMEAMKELGLKKGKIVTWLDEDLSDERIEILPAWKWLLS